MDLREALTKYKNYTLQIIESSEMEDYDPISELLNKRQIVIETIGEMDYTIEEFSVIANELQIMFFEKRLNDVVIEKKNKLRIKLDKLLENKNANKTYNKKFYVDALFFNKKI
ncbi:hypothetical protein CLHOM_06300 [Clostridium homopropionicum DSM 5847]|uniref:Flagellar protein FliT n=1 Tax=Clostridium homopropionicum DSM 5847 TaxID=1121318 RepID=A0A0L6ZDL3_9CLOT|nr:flagellar protein FliT [Clostridium homopropionicum]KOA21042.1 hypothetical protein CLHOM_06300 [Clostridium homopropionicum DSM 5847]SFF98705.1 hypothetical protein SAMN04488501_10490 [Clostridium homopropionicum]